MSEWLKGYRWIAEMLGTNREQVARTLRSFRNFPPVNDLQRGMCDALLDSVGC